FQDILTTDMSLLYPIFRNVKQNFIKILIKGFFPDSRQKFLKLFLTESDTLCFMNRLWNEKIFGHANFFPLFFSALQATEIPHPVRSILTVSELSNPLCYIKGLIPRFRTKILKLFLTETNTHCFINKLR
ncbi:MAG: hypothetical protein BWK80_21460, partial [Desulfobacteraceae bacterium IS3]